MVVYLLDEFSFTLRVLAEEVEDRSDRGHSRVGIYNDVRSRRARQSVVS